MALSPTEQRLVKIGQQMGKTPDEIKLGIYNLRTGTKPVVLSAEPEKEPNYFQRVGEDITTRADKVGQIISRPTPLPIKATQVFGQGTGMAANIVEQLPVVKQGLELMGKGIEWLSNTKPVQAVAGVIGGNKTLQEITTLYDTDQDFKDTVDATANIARLGGDIQGIVDGAAFSRNVASKLSKNLPPVPTAQDFALKLPEGKTVAQEILDIENNYVKTRKINIAKPDDAEAGALRIQESNVLPNSVDEAGKLDTMSPGKAYDQYKAQTLDSTDALGRKVLEKEGATVNWKELVAQMKAELGKAPITSDAYTAGLAKIKAVVRGLQSRGLVDVLGDIKLADIHGEKTSTYGIIKDFTTPAETKATVKSFARAYKNIIEKKSRTNIKEINAELGKYLGDLERIANLNGKLVRGGKLGKYAAQIGGNVAGALVGNALGGPIAGAMGTVAGGEVASLIKGKQMASTFGKDTGTRAPKSEILETAKADVVKPKVRDLKTPDKKVGASKSIKKNKEIYRLEKEIADNVEAQKRAIKAKDFDLVSKLKETYDYLVSKLKDVIQKIKDTPNKQGGFARISLSDKSRKSQSPTPSKLSPSEDTTTHLAKAQEALREAKGLSASDIMAKYPDINLKRDVTVTDIHGNKKVIPEGEALTPYELKGNKVLLQDGETYIVSKNQWQNIKGQAVSGEAKPFAPELEGLEETVRGGGRWRDDELTVDGETVANLLKNEDGTWSFQSDFSDGSEAFYKTRREAMDAAEMSTVGDIYGETGTKYSQYTLPGGENYREVLIKAPQKYKGTGSGLPDGYSYSTSVDGYQVINDSTKKVVGESQVSQEKALQNALKEIGQDPIFKSSHWDEPNVISHLRLNERTYKGKPVTFMEELQSDWAREGRSKGFANPEQQKLVARRDEVASKIKQLEDSHSAPFDKKMGELDDKIYALRTKAEKPFQEKYDYYSGIASRRSLTPAEERAYNKYENLMIYPWDEIVVKDKVIYPKIQALEAEQKAMSGQRYESYKKMKDSPEYTSLQSEYEKLKNVDSAIPNNPLLKNWQTLSVKRALQEAVANKSEYFAWINGEQTSARYNLATYVQDVKWQPFEGGTDSIKGQRLIFLQPKDGITIKIRTSKEGEILSSDNGWKGKKLDEVLGKGLADSIMSKESGTLSGDGLKFGGEWANTLYDKQVGNIVKDVTGGEIIDMDMGLPVEKAKTQFTIARGERGTDFQPIRTSDLEVGKQISNGRENYIITDILGDGKFKAVPKDKVIITKTTKDLTKKGSGGQPIEMKDVEIGDTLLDWSGGGPVPFEVLEKKTNSLTLIKGELRQSFDISTKTTTQQGIKLTPEIIARIKGEAIPLKKASGRSPL